MKKLLVTLLVATTALNFMACGATEDKSEGNTEEQNSGVATTDEKVTISVQVEEEWLPYYEQVRDTVVEKYPNATINFITTGSFDHLDVIDQTSAENTDVADVFALPADRLYGLANNDVLAAIDAKTMASEVGGFKDFDNGLGGNFNVDGEYLAFPYNIETLIGYVNLENAATAGINLDEKIEFTDLEYNQILTTVHDCWYGVAFTNSAAFELLSDELKSDATKDWADLTDEQKSLFEGLFNYWKAHKENGTSLWDKDAAGGYIDEQFKTGGTDAIKIDGPWASTSVVDLVGSADNLEVIPLNQITFNGEDLQHWKGGWGLGINARCEEDEAVMEVAQEFIKEIVNPDNAQELFKYTGKVLENVDASAYEGIDELEKKVIDATYEAYESAVNRPLFDEYGQVWASWQNALLSWSAKNPADAEAAYAEVQASFNAMMQNINQ